MQILLVHGLCRTPLSLAPLAYSLRRYGHDPRFFGYVAMVEAWPAVQARLRKRLTRMARSGNEYAVIAHSLGGVLTAGALADWPPHVPRPSHLITLGTPVRPPRLARKVSRFAAFRLATGEAGRRLSEPETYAPLRALDCRWTAICGTAGPRGKRIAAFGAELNDGVLAVSEAESTAASATVQVGALHTFLMNDKSARALIRNALNREQAHGVSHG
jgi:pimeloyl-ACP methyl ester carboxylesterase